MLHTLTETLPTHLPTVLAVASQNTGAILANQIRDWVAPIVLLGVGLCSLNFLVQRQMTKFLEFFAITVFVGVFFWNPEIVIGLAGLLSKALS